MQVGEILAQNGGTVERHKGPPNNLSPGKTLKLFAVSDRSMVSTESRGKISAIA